MSQKEVAGVTIDIDDNGYMTNFEQWSKEVAIELAKENGIDEPHLRDAMVEAVKANAVINDSTWASIEDVAEVVDMVLGHRIEPDD